MSAWRGEVNLLDLTKPEYRPFHPPSPNAAASPSRRSASAIRWSIVIEALARIGIARAS